MRAECQFARAGQGLFYNGFIIDNDGKKFSFVYDCGEHGSKKQVLSESVADYKSFIGNRLDLLFISHFHRDHVSHIPELLDGISLGTVVIPYVQPDMRLLLAAQIEGIESDDDDDFIPFYSNPEQYFFDHGAEHVCIIHGFNDDFKIDEKTSYEFTVLDDDGTKINGVRYLKSENDQYHGRLEEYNEAAIIHRYNWEFNTFNPYRDDFNAKLLEHVNEILKTDDSFQKILSNDKFRKRLKKIYEDNFKDNINETSLLVHSYPLPMESGHIVQNQCEHADTFLTGDITIEIELLERVQEHFHFKRMPGVVLIPHHGSKINTYCELCHKNFINCWRDATTYAVSFGLSNIYGHPHMLHHKNCCRKSFEFPRLRLVNERNDFSYTVIFRD